MPTRLETLGEWAVGVRVADIPARVMDAARTQLVSVLASLYAGGASEAGRLCRDAALDLGTTGKATVLPTGEAVHPYAAVLANAALSMAHDFDDYLFLGHTGHSAVLASLAAAEQVDASVEDLLAAQVVANELAGRLGAYVSIGPQNGQLWAHIHLAGAAAAAARLYGLDAEQAADALAIAFYQPPFTLFAGFMGSESKALTAAQPAAMGLYAAGLAARGMRGMREILEHRRGFGQQFAFIPVQEVLGGLGSSWVTDSLSCKIYPGCAYIDGPVDAALAARGDEALPASEIERVDIRATALTAGMEAIAEDAAPADSLDPIPVSFSARRSVAIALLRGRLAPEDIEGPWLADNADAVRTVAANTRVSASGSQTTDMLAGIGRAVPLMGLARSIGVQRAWRARHQIRAAYLSAASKGSGPSSGRRKRRVPAFDPMGALGVLVKVARARKQSFDMNEVDFTRLQFRFSADVRITLRGGRTLEGSQTIPLGAAGRDPAEMRVLMANKLRSETADAGVPDRADAVEEILAAPAADTPVRKLARAACAAGATKHALRPQTGRAR